MAMASVDTVRSMGGSRRMNPRVHRGTARVTARHAVGFVGVLALAITGAFIPIVHSGRTLRAWVGASSKSSLFASNLCVRLRGRCVMPALAETVQPLDKIEGTQLHQLAKVTTISIDTGDLDIIEQYAKTGLITDATTNPLFVSQAGLSGNPRYVAFVKEAIEYAKTHHSEGALEEDVVNLAMDRLAVNLGREIATLVSGFVSTEVDIRESFDVETSVARARRIIAMYEELGVPRTRILIKLAATWEGIKAAETLEKEGIRCNLTLVFGFAQAVACAQAGVQLISPFPGRVLDWYKNNGGEQVYAPEEDPGVVAVKRMAAYFKRYGHDRTICMPASWRPSRGAGFETDEILALAGVDRMTIPPPLLDKLGATTDELPYSFDAATAGEMFGDAEVDGGNMTEKTFRMMMNADVCSTTKLAEGINAFVAETVKLRDALVAQL